MSRIVNAVQSANLNAAKLLCLNKIGSILFVESKRYWTLPGGKPNPGEDIYKCLFREVREELPNIIYSIRSWRQYQKEGFNNLVAIGYCWQLQLQIANEILQYRWIRPSDVSQYSEYWFDFVRML